MLKPLLFKKCKFPFSFLIINDEVPNETLTLKKAIILLKPGRHAQRLVL